MLLRAAVIGLNHGRTYSQFARDGRNPGDSCKGARESRGTEDYGVQSTEDRGETGAKVQIGAELLCTSGKVSAAEGRKGTGWLEYGWLGVSRRRLRSTEYRVR